MTKKKKVEVLAVDADIMRTQTIFDQTSCDGTEQDALVSITVPRDGYLRGIFGTILPDFDADSEYVVVEISKSGNYQANISDNADSMLIISSRLCLVTSGGGNSALNAFVTMKIFFRAGEKIYVNQWGSNGLSMNKYFVLYWEDFL